MSGIERFVMAVPCELVIWEVAGSELWGGCLEVEGMPPTAYRSEL